MPRFDEGFGLFLKDPHTYSDVTLKVKGKEYKVHKIIVSYASNYFANLLKEDVSEVEISDFDVAEVVFEEVLKFLYTGEANVTEENLVALKLAANHFQLDQLGKLIAEFVQSCVKAENVFELLETALEKTGTGDSIVEKCIDYIAENIVTLKEKLEEKMNNFPLPVVFKLIGNDHIESGGMGHKKSKLVSKLARKYADSKEILSDDENFQNLITALLKSKMLTPDDATFYLLHCEKRKMTEQALGCARVLSGNFKHLEDQSVVLQLSPESFCEILQYDELFIENEDEVLKIALKYLDEHKDLTEEQKKNVMSSIRYTFLSVEKLKELQKNPPPYVETDIIIDSLWARVGRLEGVAKSDEPGDKKKAKHLQPRKNKIFTYQSDFDKNGILYHLGTSLGTQNYKNPTSHGFLNVQSNNTPETGTLWMTCDHVSQKCNLNNKPNTHIIWEFPKHKVLPTNYTLRHTLSRDSEVMRNWDIYGQEADTDKWVLLKQHKNDTGIPALKGASHTWKIDAKGVYYKAFKLEMTGPNSSNNNYLSLGGSEWYGMLADQ